MIQEIKFSDILEQVKLLLQFCLKNPKLFFIIIFSTCLISIVYWSTLNSNFKASTTFIVEESSSKGGGLSGIASQFGVDLGSVMGGSGSSLFSGDNIFDIFRTRTMVEKVLLSEFDDTTTESGKQTFADAYMKMYPSFVKTIILGNKTPVGSFYGYDNHLHADRVKDSVLSKIFEKLIKNNLIVQKSNKKGSIIQVSVLTNDEYFSKIFNERLIEEAKTKELKGIVWQVLDWNEKAIQFYQKYASSFDSEWINCSLTTEQINSSNASI